MRHCLAALALWLPTLAATAAERTWTDVKGRQMRADFVRESGGTVTFLKDGKLVDFPLAELSARDQQAVRDLAAGRLVADDADPPQTNSPAPKTAAASQPAGDEAAPAAGKKPIPIVKRVWTDKFGNQSQAKFVRMFGNSVVLTKINNQTIRVPFYDLTSEDQDYVRELLASRGEESLLPAPPPPPATETPQPAAPSPSPAPGFTPPSFTPPGFSPPSFTPPPIPGSGSSFAEEMRQRAEQQREEFQQRLEQQRQEQADRAQKLQEEMERRRQEMDAARQNRIVGECLSCKGKLTEAQTEQANCPHCGIKWEYEVDAFGHRKPIYRNTSDSGGASAAGNGTPKLNPATVAQARRIIVIGVAVVGVLGMFAVVVFVAITVAAAGSAKSRQKFY